MNKQEKREKGKEKEYRYHFDNKDNIVYIISLATYTGPNIRAIYYGAALKGNGTHFGYYFKENGYITERVNSYCEKELTNNIDLLL